MAITVECPDCKRAYAVDEKMLGQRVKCKTCGNVFTLEAPAPPSLSEIDPFANADFESTPGEKPAGETVKLYNPVETISAPKQSAPPPAANAKSSIFGTLSGDFGTSPSLTKVIYLVLGLFISFSIGLGIYWTTQAYMDVKDNRLATTAVVHIWEWIALFDVMLFLLLAPLLWLGVWATSKLLNFRIPDSPYLRACAVAAMSAMIAGVAELSPDLLKITLFVLLLPAIYYVLKIAFDLDWTQSGVALAFGAGASLLGVLVNSMVLGMVMTGNVFTAVDSARQLADADATQRTSKTASSADSDTGDSTPPLPASQDPAAYERFKDLVREKTNADISQSTREEHLPEVLDLKRQLASLKVAFHEQADWPEQVRAIEAFEQRVMGLPSSKFSDDIYTDSADADDWSTGSLSRRKLGPEVSFRQFKFQPPLDMKLDLRSSAESVDGLIWIGIKFGDARLSLRTLPRKNQKQRKPALSDKPSVLHAAEAAGILALNSANIMPAEGQINGMTTTRLTATDGSRTVQYYIPIGDEWLVMRVTSSGDPKFAKVADAAARTLREIETGETAADPFGPSPTARRLVDDFEHAAAILQKEGDAGEDAVAALLLNEDRNIRQQALTYLKDYATDRSLAALRHAALDPDTGLADLAKAALSRIGSVAQTQPASGPASQAADVPAPAKIVDVAGMLADLRSNETAVRKQAVQKLLLTPPVDNQRRAVSSKLAAMMRNHDPCASTEEYTKALIAWGDAGVGADLLPLLKEGGEPEPRHAAMKIFAALKAPGTATAIAKWLKGDPAPAANALVDMGPEAEPAVIASLRDADPNARIEATRLLAQIGTRKCIAELTRATHDAHDPNTQQAAKSALEAVKARIGSDAGQPDVAPKQ